MNKGDIRTRVLEQVDWQPDQSASFKDKIDQMINRAYNHLALEAPFLFFEEQCRVVTEPDASNGTSTGDLLGRHATDTRVLYRTVTDAHLADGTATTWKFDGTWDGRMVEIARTDGTVYRRRIREVLRNDDADPELHFLILEQPWDHGDVGSTVLKYRIFTPEYELPADIVELRSARIYGDTHYDLEVRNQYDMERYDYVDYQGIQQGRPTTLFRGRHHQIDAPMVPAQIELTDENTLSLAWQGPDNPGTFDYCFTYVWGKRDSELQAPNSHFEPKWESAPSPISTEVTATSASSVILTLPFIDQGLDDYYYQAGTTPGDVTTRPRAAGSGIRIRIYVRRHTNDNLDKIPHHPMNDGVFYLLDEIDGGATDGLVRYTHNGNTMPEYRRRLKEIHGYQTIRLHPMPDARYEVDCRVLRKPQKLINDQDAPRIHVEAVEALIQKTLGMVHLMEGASDLAIDSETRYQAMLLTLTKRYGLIPRVRPTKKIARVRRPYRDVRVRYTESS